MPMKSHLPSVLILSLLLALPACAKQPSATKTLNSMQGMKQETQDRIFAAAQDAAASDNMPEALRMYRELYKMDETDQKVALRYAQLLRKAGKTESAIKILTPLAVEKGGRPMTGADPELLLELSAAHVAEGNFDNGEILLNAVLENSKAGPLHIEAYNMMGVVLDAKGQHREAENMFNQALEGWQGNPASVMNNLALSLANQGLFDQSLTTLRKALVISPDKQEVARNIQIVQDLRDNIVPGAPTKLLPAKKVIKPKIKKEQPACPPCPDKMPG